MNLSYDHKIDIRVTLRVPFKFSDDLICKSPQSPEHLTNYRVIFFHHPKPKINYPLSVRQLILLMSRFASILICILQSKLHPFS